MGQTSEWLKKLGLGQYAQRFAENDINFAILPELTDQDLKEIGVSSLGHRRQLLSAIAELKGIERIAPKFAVAAAAVPSPPDAAERRQVTVMFCDLVGSTALSARMDPEDLREVISAYQKCVAETVNRFDGFVAKYMGDGVLVYFGYPRAHEDDAERAVRAGLQIIHAVGTLNSGMFLQTRIGIATGLVVVGDLVGSGEAQERGIVGETPNLAARLQGIAEPNTIVIADSTRRLVGNLFELQDLGAKDLKGFAEPARAWAALRTRSVESRFDAMHATGLIPLVGREEEIELLHRRWEQVKSGEERVVLISGEPGIGKSRIVAAFRERIQSESHTRLHYSCSPHHTDSALHPIIAQLEQSARFEREDTPDEKLGKLDGLLARTATSAEDMALLAELLSLPAADRYPPLNLSLQRKKEKTFEALVRQIAELARRTPVLMIFEDVHWIDPSSLDALSLAIERLHSLPVLVLVTFRPDFQPPWLGQSNLMMLSLSRLGRPEREALARHVAGNRTLSSDLLDKIVERTDGVPLFVEELTKAVLEASGAQDEKVTSLLPLRASNIPATLHASLMARLDRLGSAKQVAEIGAAIGREFSYELVAAVARHTDSELQDALDRLTKAGLVLRRGTSSRPTFMFKHALVRDAAYSALLRSQRQELHARISKTLEERFPETVRTEPEILAHHFSEAGLNADAVAYWQRAGERALQQSAHLEAVRHLNRGLEVNKAMQPGRDRDRRELNLQLALAAAVHANKGQAARELGEAYDKARQLCEQLDDAPQLFRVLMGLFRFHGPTEKGRSLADQLLKLAQQTQDPDLLIEGTWVMALHKCYPETWQPRCVI